MQDTRNENASALLAVKHDVLGMLQTVQARANVMTKAVTLRFCLPKEGQDRP
jgi:hypothetical protein